MADFALAVNHGMGYILPMTIDDVCRLLVVACYDAGGREAFGQKHEFSRSYLSAVLTKKKPPSKRLLDLLGVEKVKTVTVTVSYRRKKR